MTHSEDVHLADYLVDRPAEPGRHSARVPAARAHKPPRRTAGTFAVVLHFDEFSEHRVRQAWTLLDRNGVPSAKSTYDAGYRPHVTLAMVNTREPERLAAPLRRALAGVAGIPLTLTALGFFLTDRSPAYLAVSPTRRLLEVHERVHAAIGTQGSWSYYQPGNWMPHCTLAMDVECQTTVADALSDDTLPIQATVGSAHFWELPPQPKSHRRAQGGAHRRADTRWRAPATLQRLLG